MARNQPKIALITFAPAPGQSSQASSSALAAGCGWWKACRMGIVNRGFTGRRRSGEEDLPPGQYLVTDFPVLSAGPTPRVNLASWELRVTTETGQAHTWDWAALHALPIDEM